MAHGIHNVSKSRPCPICGKPDWCGSMPATDGGNLVICMRDTDQSNKLGFDGNFYVCVGKSRSGNTIFEEANQRRAKEIARGGSSKDYNYAAAKVPEQRKLTVVDQVDPLPNKKMDIIYRTMLSFLTLEPEHREYLHYEGWTDELIDKNHIVSFPEKDYTRFKYRKDTHSQNPYRKRLAKQIINKLGLDGLKGVPGAYKDTSGNWTFAGRSGILFPQYDTNHLMYRVRLRMDFQDPSYEIHSSSSGEKWFIDEKGDKNFISMKGIYQIKNGERKFDKSLGKYRNFASYHIDEEEEKRGFIVNSYDSGCESGNQLGFYYNEQRDDMYIAYATEGEKKGIFSNEVLRAPFVSFPGVNSWSILFSGKDGERPIDILKAKGVRIFVVAYDADKCINEKVLKAEKQAIDAIRNEGFIMGLAEWDIKLGKGIDDLLKNGYKPSYVPV